MGEKILKDARVEHNMDRESLFQVLLLLEKFVEEEPPRPISWRERYERACLEVFMRLESGIDLGNLQIFGEKRLGAEDEERFLAFFLGCVFGAFLARQNSEIQHAISPAEINSTMT
jgi:hypothetical protein